MDDRQIMYQLCQKESKKIDGIINEYYKDQKDASIIKKGLNLYFFNRHKKEYPKNRDWKKFVNTKGLYEYFSFQNKIISLIFAKDKNSKEETEKKEIISENIKKIIWQTMTYISDSRLSYKYQNDDYFDDTYLFCDNELLDQPEIFANKLEKPTKKEKENLTKEDIVCSLAKQTRYYLENYNNKVRDDDQISVENFLEKVNLGRYTKDVKQKLLDENKKEIQNLVSQDEDNEEYIEEYNNNNPNPPNEFCFH